MSGMAERPFETDANADVRRRWDGNAEFWDAQMGADGNDFHLQLVRPAVERLLGDVAGARVLEIACGNGLFARRLAELGASVVATDTSAAMLERARTRNADGIDYRELDAADPAQFERFEGGFDAVVCNMALMDMADIEPLAVALPRLLADAGRFVFSITHPCFNTLGVRFVHEFDDRNGVPHEMHGVVVSRYITPTSGEGVAIFGQPLKQLYFDRPLSDLLRPFLAVGLAVDGLEEPAFPAPTQPGPLTWEALPEIPPVLAVRLRR
jgi:SAM-dependent methyltransferase